MKKLILMVIVILVIVPGCNNEHGHSHDDGGHSHGLEVGTISHTIWTDKTELFVEFTPLVARQITIFAAHFSSMEDFKAIEKGSLTVSLIRNGKGIRHTVNGPGSPGIFRPALQPKEKGIYQLIFDIQTGEIDDKIVIDSVFVYENIEEAIVANPAEPKGNEISFLKEQAWKIDFAIEQVKRQSIHQVIKTSGKIEARQGDETLITAKASGIVFFNLINTRIGNEVNSNKVLFTISGEGIADNNIEFRYAAAKAEYEKADVDYERGKELIKEKIISQKSFHELKAKFEVTKINFDIISANYSKGGQQIRTPFAGFIKNIMVSDGQYVQSGEPLAVITQNKKLIIHADVSQKYFAELPQISSANFKTAYDPVVYSIDDFNGKILSYGKTVGNKANYLPVYFEIDNKGKLLSGSFVEVYLKTIPVKNAVVISQQAIMEDYENHYVFVQTAGESFEKRNVKIGISDGMLTQILSGVNEGEWVVTKGAYQVKMASMSSAIPAHGHSH